MTGIKSRVLPIMQIAALIFLAAGCAQKSPASGYNTPLQVGSRQINVQVVTTPEQMSQGLSGRKSMTDQEGMLFDFKKPGRPGFWMKDMNFNLDFVWIANKKIVQITPNVPAPVKNEGLRIKDKGLKIKDYPMPVYYPQSDIDMVLEVNGGWSEKYGVKMNDKIVFQ